MTILQSVPEDEATGLVAELYADDRAALGYVPERTRAFSVHPEAYQAYEAVIKTVFGSLGLRHYELVTLAAARAIGSRECLLAHGRKSLGVFDEAQLVRIARDYRDAGLTEAEVAMMAFAERLSGDSASMTEEDSQTLRDHGFTDRQILDIAMAAGARNMYSRVLHALGVRLDVPPGLTPELQAALIG